MTDDPAGSACNFMPRSQLRHSTPTTVGGRTIPHGLSPDYMVGLVDGEGSFCVFLRQPAKETWRTRVECHFYIKMRHDELPLLEKVRNFFGCGRISFQKEYRVNQQNNYRFQVSNLKDLHSIIVPFFKTHRLQSTARKKDFDLFCRIMKNMVEKNHKTDDGLNQIQQLKSQMHM